MIDMRPHFDGSEEEGKSGYLTLDEDVLLATQGMSQFRADALLNELAELVRRADVPWGNRFRLLHDIGTLRGYVQNESRRVLSETQGRCN